MLADTIVSSEKATSPPSAVHLYLLRKRQPPWSHPYRDLRQVSVLLIENRDTQSTVRNRRLERVRAQLMLQKRGSNCAVLELWRQGAARVNRRPRSQSDSLPSPLGSRETAILLTFERQSHLEL